MGSGGAGPRRWGNWSSSASFWESRGSALWIAACPLAYASPNAPAVADVLGTALLAALIGACRYAHVTVLRGDQVNPQGLAMAKGVSEDSLRRAFQNEGGAALARWQTDALREAYAPALDQPWIADLDVTIEPVYGHQEGAELGYNPHKPGRPSHAYHTVFLRAFRWPWMWKCVRERSTPPRVAWRTCGACGIGWRRASE